MKHVTCKECGHHTVTDNTAKRIACGNCWADIQDEPVNAESVTCGNCGTSWCERCDPAPAALCHVCHGRGFTTAEIEEAA